MNLSPRWVDYLTHRGWQARHWSAVGEASAEDATIMAVAQTHGEVVVTNELNFGTLLALSGDGGPSVIQLRATILAPEVVGPRVLECLERFGAQIAAGALVVMDDRRGKVRLLPIAR